MSNHDSTNSNSTKPPLSPHDKSDHHFLDTSGLACPLPVLKTRKAINNMDSNNKLLVRVTDPGAPQDLKALCQKINTSILSTKHHPQTEQDDFWDILIQKK